MNNSDNDLIERIARAIHDGPNAQEQYVEAGIAPHKYDDCRWKREYREDAAAASK